MSSSVVVRVGLSLCLVLGFVSTASAQRKKLADITDQDLRRVVAETLRDPAHARQSNGLERLCVGFEGANLERTGLAGLKLKGAPTNRGATIEWAVVPRSGANEDRIKGLLKEVLDTALGQKLLAQADFRRVTYEFQLTAREETATSDPYYYYAAYYSPYPYYWGPPPTPWGFPCQPMVWAIAKPAPGSADPTQVGAPPTINVAGLTAVDGERLFGQGYSYYWQKHYQHAKVYFDVAAQLDPQDARIWFYKALAEHALKNDDAAKQAVAQGLAAARQGKPGADLIVLSMERLQGADRKWLLETADSVQHPKAPAAPQSPPPPPATGT